MARTNLTPRFIESRKPALSGQRLDYADAQVPGIALRVTDRGHKSFVLIARFRLIRCIRHAAPSAITSLRPVTPAALPMFRVSIAPSPIGLSGARARLWLELISRGIDPKAEAERERVVVMRKQANSVAAVVKDFLDRPHTKKYAKFKDCERCLADFTNRCGKRPITDIGTHDVTTAIKAITARGAVYQAHNYSGYVRRLFNWAIGTKEYGLAVPPIKDLDLNELIGKREIRNRVLSDWELREVWQAAGALGYPYGPVVRLLGAMRRGGAQSGKILQLRGSTVAGSTFAI